jgi:hypothetical protein
MTLAATTTDNNKWEIDNTVADPEVDDRNGASANIFRKIFSAFSFWTAPTTKGQTTENYLPKGFDTLTIGDQKDWLFLLTARSLVEADQDEISKIVFKYQTYQDAFSLAEQSSSTEAQIEANQAALALLEEWMSEPDDLGDDWWDDFENDLRQNRFSLNRD